MWAIALLACEGTPEEPPPLVPYTEWVGEPSDGIGGVVPIDLEGDGLPELFFGTLERGYLLNVLDSGVLSDLALLTLENPSLDPVGQPWGLAVDGVGDLDGDGHEDVEIRDGDGRRICWTDPDDPFAVGASPCIPLADPSTLTFVLGDSDRRLFLDTSGRARVSPVSRAEEWSLDVLLSGEEADAAATRGNGDLLVGTGEHLAWMDAPSCTNPEDPLFRKVAASAFGAAPAVTRSWTWSEQSIDDRMCWRPARGPEIAGVEGWAAVAFVTSFRHQLVALRTDSPDASAESLRFTMDITSTWIPADFDGDGDQDLLVTLGTSGLYFFFAPFEDRTYTMLDADAVVPMPEAPKAVRYEDVDGDGLPDLFLGHVTSNAGGAGSGAVRMIRGSNLRDFLASEVP